MRALLLAAVTLALACSTGAKDKDSEGTGGGSAGGSAQGGGSGGSGGGSAQGGGSGGSGGGMAAPPTLDKAAARARFATTTELMRYVVAPGCAAERNECHNSEDFPDLSSEGNLWNLVNLPCNQGLGERNEVEDFCESLGDELRIEAGANSGFTARIGSIKTVTNATTGAFQYYEVLVDKAATAAQTGASFGVLRGGTKIAALGGGASAELQAGQKWVRVRNAGHIPSLSSVVQGDENRNGVFGAGRGLLVKANDAHQSYLVRRLLAKETNRIRMPLGANADNPTEINRPLSLEEAYALMSWINCMQAGDGPYSPIRYDCPANAGNEGVW